jgi:hypothetical protein
MFQHAFILGFPSADPCLIGFLLGLCFLLSIAKMPASYSTQKNNHICTDSMTMKQTIFSFSYLL